MWRELRPGVHFGDQASEPLSPYAGSLLKHELICVHVCSFTFRFVSKNEIEEYIRFYQAKTHPSSRVPGSMLPDCNFRHWHSQRWYERLPLFLQEKPKKEKILKALNEAIARIEAGKL